MKNYKLAKSIKINGQPEAVFLLLDGGDLFIPFDSANADYIKFKIKINDDKATLQDADGNTMTAEEAKQFIATLP